MVPAGTDPRLSRHPAAPLETGPLLLSGPVAHHLNRVLRVRPGEKIRLFDGQGREAEAVVVSRDGDRVRVEVGEVRTVRRESPLPLTLAFALSKGEKPEWIAQKSVELGVAALVVFAARRSVVHWSADAVEHKLRRLREVVRGACAQCGRTVEPSLRYADSCGAAIALTADRPLRLALDATAARPLAAFLPLDRVLPVCLLSGPEGGLAADELEELTAGGWRTARLGPRILRAETAALAAVALVQGLAGDLGAPADGELQ